MQPYTTWSDVPEIIRNAIPLDKYSTSLRKECCLAGINGVITTMPLATTFQAELIRSYNAMQEEQRRSRLEAAGLYTRQALALEAMGAMYAKQQGLDFFQFLQGDYGTLPTWPRTDFNLVHDHPRLGSISISFNSNNTTEAISSAMSSVGLTKEEKLAFVQGLRERLKVLSFDIAFRQ